MIGKIKNKSLIIYGIIKSIVKNKKLIKKRKGENEMSKITQKKFNDVVGSLQKTMENLEIEFKEVIGSPKEQRELFMKNVESIPEAKEGEIPDEVAVVYNSFVDEKLEDVVAWEEVKKDEKKIDKKKKEIIKADDPIPEKVIPKVVKAKKETKVVPKVTKKEEKLKVEKEVKEEKKDKKESKVVSAEKEVKEVKKEKIPPKERKERAKEKDLSVFGHRANSLAGVLDTMFNSGITLKDAIHTLLEKFPKKNEYQVGERFFGYIRLLEKDKIIVETPKVEGGKYKVKK
jgi:hypothetical protein